MFAGLLLAAMALSGCVSPPPAEFALYQQSFAEARSASGEVLTTYAPFERSIRGPQDDSSFDPDQAAFMVDDALPGLAQQIDRGFAAVDSYNTVLVRYAGGDSIEAIKPQIGVFAKQATLAANMVVPGITPAIEAGANLLTQVAGALLAVADRAAFREVVARNSDKVTGFIDAARSDSSLMYSAGRNVLGDQIAAALRAGDDDKVKQLQAQRQQYRVLLARWVLLLDDLRSAVDALHVAVTTDQGTALTAAQFDFWATELRERAEGIRFSAKTFRAAL